MELREQRVDLRYNNLRQWPLGYIGHVCTICNTLLHPRIIPSWEFRVEWYLSHLKNASVPLIVPLISSVSIVLNRSATALCILCISFLAFKVLGVWVRGAYRVLQYHQVLLVRLKSLLLETEDLSAPPLESETRGWSRRNRKNASIEAW